MIHQRETVHQQAQSWIQKADYRKASLLLQQAHQNLGPHVGLLSDLAVCHYMLDQISDWSLTIDLLIEQYQQAEGLLSAVTSARTMLMLGMFEEERGHLTSALKWYSCCAIRTDISSNLVIKARSQRLRLKSFLGLPDNDGDYAICLAFFKTGTLLQAEIEHALILTEAQLFGLEMALSRWSQTRNERPHPIDENLFYFDLLEICLREGKESLLLKENPRIKPPAPQSTFEKILLHWVQDQSLTYGFEEYYHLSKKLAPFSHLRLLAIALKTKRHTHLIRPDHLHVLIKSLPSTDQSILLDYWRDLLQLSGPLTFHPESNLVRGSERVTNFPSHSLEYQLLQLIAGQQKLETELLIQNLYHEAWSEESYNKLRALLNRLEKKLSGLTGHRKLFRLSKSHLELKVEIQ